LSDHQIDIDKGADARTQAVAGRQSVNVVVPQFTVHQLYANGFLINLSAADISIVILRDNVASATVSMSFTTAKSLVEKLGEAVRRLEKSTNNEIMTIDVIENALKKEMQPKDQK
jgi:hypothetical protein